MSPSIYTAYKKYTHCLGAAQFSSFDRRAKCVTLDWAVDEKSGDIETIGTKQDIETGKQLIYIAPHILVHDSLILNMAWGLEHRGGQHRAGHAGVPGRRLAHLQVSPQQSSRCGGGSMIYFIVGHRTIFKSYVMKVPAETHWRKASSDSKWVSGVPFQHTSNEISH